MDGEQVPGMNPVTERQLPVASQPETEATSNFTPLPRKLLESADHAKHRALDAWRRVIHGSRKAKEIEPKTEQHQAVAPKPQQKQEEKGGMTGRGFLAGLGGLTLGIAFGRGEAQAAPTPKDGPGKVINPERQPPEGSVHLVTSAEYTPSNPSPDFLKGQQIGYVEAKETLFDGSKLWPLDWQLKPIDPKDMVYNLPGQRSIASFREATHYLNLGHPDNGRYAKVDNTDGSVTTFCNVAASDMADMFQVHHVFSRFDENGTPIVANTMNERIISEASRKDQEPGVALISKEEAQQIADMGFPVFLSIKKERKTPKANWMSGHIGLLTPRSMLDRKNPDHRKQGIYLTQAGSESGDAIYFDEPEKYNEENGYLQPIFAIDVRDLQDARKKITAPRTLGH
ncbi:hypothetical protein IPM65_03480 [Candidatus Roizmanbacteria bacterium]|nr:MAG: hypothetical protein IPM65_03480 [Candidatus Roizmanbacteria bacterium]